LQDIRTKTEGIIMTKDELYNTAPEQDNQIPSIKKDTAGTASVQARAPQPPVPVMPVAKNIKITTSIVPPGKEGD
jgi:hypothetical protein